LSHAPAAPSRLVERAFALGDDVPFLKLLGCADQLGKLGVERHRWEHRILDLGQCLDE
jgi:hypothetical protein